MKTLIGLCAAGLFASLAVAAVSPQEAARLGAERISVLLATVSGAAGPPL